MKSSNLLIPNWSKVLLFAVASVAALLQSGCVAVVAAGAAGTGVAWYKGRLEANVNADIDDTFKASQKALTQLEFAKIKDHKSAVDAELVARTALDKRVEIQLTRVTSGTTKIEIRVGVFGDESLSMLILEKIKAAL